MVALKRALYVILKRPFIICFTGFIALLYCIIDFYNPLTRILVGFDNIGKGDFLESIVYTIQLLRSTIMNTKNFLTDIIFFLLFLTLISIVLGVLLSGYFSIINKALDGIPKSRGELLQGTKKYGIRTAWVFFRVIFSGLLVFIILLIASLPAVIVTKAWLSGKTELTLVMAFLDVMTLGILFFGLIFFSVYVLFWFPSTLNFDKKAFSIAKRTADNDFWHVVLQLIIFEAAFLIIHFVLSLLSGSFPNFISFTVAWLVKTMFFTLFAVFIFSSFKVIRKKHSIK